jgi:hypothetical protein
MRFRLTANATVEAEDMHEALEAFADYFLEVAELEDGENLSNSPLEGQLTVKRDDG